MLPPPPIASLARAWMRGAALAPKDAVVTYSDAELPKLDSFRNNYSEACAQIVSGQSRDGRERRHPAVRGYFFGSQAIFWLPG